MIDVAKATPAITWNAPGAIIYGTPLSPIQLNATTNILGEFDYTPPVGSYLSAGTGQTLTVTFEPTDAANHVSVRATTTIDVVKAAPAITWGAPGVIAFGVPLSATELNATSNVPGDFDYTPPVGSYLSTGSGQTLTVTFKPTDAANHVSVRAATTIDVARARPAITWRAPTFIRNGTALSRRHLNAKASVNGTFMYTPGVGTVLPEGDGQTLSLTFAPTDATNYVSVTARTTIDVRKTDQWLSIRVAGVLAILTVFLFLVIGFPKRTAPHGPVEAPVTSLAPIPEADRVTTVSSNHRWVVTSDKDGHTSILDLLAVPPTPRQIEVLDLPVLAVSSTDSGGDTRLATLRENNVILVDAWSGKSLALPSSSEFSGHVESLEFSPDGRTVVFATDEGEIGVQKTDGTSPPHKLQTFTPLDHAHIDGITVSRVGNRMAVASILGGAVAIYDISDVGRAVISHQLSLPQSQPFLPKSLAYDPSGKWLATGDVVGGTIRIWSVDTQTVEQQFSGSAGSVEALSFDSATQWLAAVGDEGRVTVWNVATKEATSLFPASVTSNVYAFFFGQVLYTMPNLAPPGRPGLLVRVADNAGGLSNKECRIDGEVRQMSDERGVCFFPELRGKQQLQVSGGENRSLDIRVPTIVPVVVSSQPKEWQVQRKATR
jgi:hypothetical protein